MLIYTMNDIISKETRLILNISAVNCNAGVAILATTVAFLLRNSRFSNK